MKIYNNHVKKLAIKINSCISVILNIFSLIFGIIYLINSVYSLLYDVFGVILLITFFENILLVYLNSIGINKTSELGHKIYIFCYIYLIFIILAMMGIMGGNLLIASIYKSNLINNLSAYIMIIFFYFGLLIAGIYIAIIDIKHYNNDTIWNLNEFFHRIESKRNLKIKKILRRFLIIFCWIIYSIGISFAIVIIFGSFEILTTFFAIVSGQFGIFFSFIFLSNTVLLLNLKRKKWSSKKYLRMGIIGIFVSGSLMMPLFLTNYTIYDAEKSFTETFGSDWRDKIPSSVNNYFLKTPFSLPSYFLGIPPKPCKIDKNILFYNDE